MFRRGDIETPELDARLLAEAAFGMGRLELVTRERDEAWREGLEKMQELAIRRIKGEPVVRILGEKEFFGLAFKVTPDTLVPRPETEMLVERCLGLVAGRSKKKLLDLGTGTGCIAISVLAGNLTASAVATDISAGAIETARENAETQGVTKRFDAREGSWFAPLKKGEKFDVIVANPPYIATAVIDTLRPEVKDHDPRTALDGGADGLAAYRAILAEARSWMKSVGWLVVEVGADQGRPVKALFEKAGLADVLIERDLAGLDRMVVGHHS